MKRRPILNLRISGANFSRFCQLFPTIQTFKQLSLVTKLDPNSRRKCGLNQTINLLSLMAAPAAGRPFPSSPANRLQRNLPLFLKRNSLKVTIRVSMVPRAIKLAAKEEMDLKVLQNKNSQIGTEGKKNLLLIDKSPKCRKLDFLTASTRQTFL